MALNQQRYKNIGIGLSVSCESVHTLSTYKYIL